MINYTDLPFKITQHTNHRQLLNDKNFIKYHNDLKNKIYKKALLSNGKYTCECGRTFEKHHIYRHIRSEIHYNRLCKKIKREIRKIKYLNKINESKNN